MPKVLLQIVALILVPCLLTDPVSAAVMAGAPARNVSYIAGPTIFQEQAIPGALVGGQYSGVFSRAMRVAFILGILAVLPTTPAAESRQATQTPARITQQNPVETPEATLNRLLPLQTRAGFEALLDLAARPSTPPDIIYEALNTIQLHITSEGLRIVGLEKRFTAAAARLSPANAEEGKLFVRRITAYLKGGFPPEFERTWKKPSASAAKYIDVLLDQNLLRTPLRAGATPAAIRQIMMNRLEGRLTFIQAREQVAALLGPDAREDTAHSLIDGLLDPLPGDRVPQTQFILGMENNEAAIRSLMSWPRYKAIVEFLRPNQSSRVGFIGPNEDLVELLLADYRTRRRLNTTTDQLADWIDAVLIDEKGVIRTQPATVMVNGQEIEIVNMTGTRGFQFSPLPGRIHSSSYQYLLRNKTTGFRLKGTLTEMHSDLIRYWGFHEGHTLTGGKDGYGLEDTYRVAPEDLYSLFTGKSSQADSSPVRDNRVVAEDVTQRPLERSRIATAQISIFGWTFVLGGPILGWIRKLRPYSNLQGNRRSFSKTLHLFLSAA